MGLPNYIANKKSQGDLQGAQAAEVLLILGKLAATPGPTDNLNAEIDQLDATALGVSPESLAAAKALPDSIKKRIVTAEPSDFCQGTACKVSAEVVDGMINLESMTDLAVEYVGGALIGAGVDAYKAVKAGRKVVDEVTIPKIKSKNDVDNSPGVEDADKNSGSDSSGAEGAINSPDEVGETVYHSPANPNSSGKTQNILNGINPDFLNPNSRFGKAFYVGDEADTVISELSHHGLDSTHAIKYSLDPHNAKILDLTNPEIARDWGYSGGKITDETISLGEKAKKTGYNVIKFNSERNPGGVNHAVLDDFDTVLRPETVVPVSP